jgi:DNA polymerase-3 subunit epsilon
LAGINSYDDIPTLLKTSIGSLFPGGFRPSETKFYYKNKPAIKPIGDPSKFRPDHIFYGSKLVFTGKMGSMTRDQAHQLIVDIGGAIGTSVSADTGFLVVGQQDYRIVGEDGMSNKQEKAMQLISKGSELEILSEDEFLRLI